MKLAKEFNADLTDVPLRTGLVEFGLTLLEQPPVRTKQYPLPHAEGEIVEKEVQEMLRLGDIEAAFSPNSSPVVLVQKPDGTVRFCV